MKYLRIRGSTTESLTTQMFLDKEAAMLIDGSWRANGIAQENWDNTIVMPFPAYSEDANPVATIGGTSSGFYISRKAWDDETKRDAAVNLLAFLTGEYGREQLGFLFGGELRNSAAKLTEDATAAGALSIPIGDVMNLEARNYWFSQVPAIADGTADAAAVMAETIARGAF